MAVCLYGFEYRPLFIAWMDTFYSFSEECCFANPICPTNTKEEGKVLFFVRLSLPMSPLLEYESIVIMTNYPFEFTFCWPIQAMASWKFLSASSQPMLPMLPMLPRLFLCKEPPRAMYTALSCSVHSSTLGTCLQNQTRTYLYRSSE